MPCTRTKLYELSLPRCCRAALFRQRHSVPLLGVGDELLGRRVSPYRRLPQSQWQTKTRELVSAHPLDTSEIVDVAHQCWNSIFRTKIGGKAQIGVHVFPRPQIMGAFLHELIPLEFGDRYPGIWRREEAGNEHDMVYIPDQTKSVEIKTSSSAARVFGNRSYAQPAKSGKKTKSGFYLTVNFAKFSDSKDRPNITKIHFGWLDEDDWIGQKAQTGQQSRLASHIYGSKLLPIYSLT